MEQISNISLDIHQVADAIGCSTYIITRLYKDGRTGDLVRNDGTGNKRVKLRVRVADLEDLKAIVQEHSRRQRAIKAANGEVIMNKLDALSRAIGVIAEEISCLSDDNDVEDNVRMLLSVGGFDLSVDDDSEGEV